VSQLDAGFDLATAGHDAWLQPLPDWPAAIGELLQAESAVARIVVAGVRGSAPRTSGTCMLVSGRRILGTIGGGHLEWVAIDSARRMLEQANATPVEVHRLILGADLAQCCGGVVDLWIERYTSTDAELLRQVSTAKRQGGTRLVSRFKSGNVVRELDSMNEHPTAAQASVQLNWPDTTDATLTELLDEPLPSVWLYGAGHVGQALARIVATLPVRATWIDSRRELLPDARGMSIETTVAEYPERTVSQAPRHTHFIVMTHDHALDYTLCRSILERGDFASAGVIGSKSKAARFRSRLSRDGMSSERIARLRCPIGIEGLTSKLPAVIAVAVAAELLQSIEAHTARVSDAFSAVADCDANGGTCGTCGLLHRAS
jgi:xanthine dehydrogenase accessory factor